MTYSDITPAACAHEPVLLLDYHESEDRASVTEESIKRLKGRS